MKKIIIVSLALLITLLPAVVSCGQPRVDPDNTSADVVVDSKQPTSGSGPGPLTRERLDELHEKYKDDPLRFDAAVYAEAYGVTVEEGIRRLELQNSGGIGELETELNNNEKETFAGLWLEHTPEFKVVITFTRNGGETIKKYVKEDSPLADIIEVRNLEVTVEELQAAQKETMELLNSLGLFSDSSINIKENQVEVYVTDSELFYDTLREAGKKLPKHVMAIIIYEPLDEPPPGINPDPSVHFPQLKTRSGSFMEARMVGELALEDGYLRVGGSLIIWQPDYFVHNNNGTIEVLDRDGVVVGRVGEEIVMGGGGIPFEHVNKLLKEPLPSDIEGPFFLQGGGTRLSLNFSSDLFDLQVIDLREYNVYFLTRKPLLDEFARQEITLTGSLVASYNSVIIQAPHIRVEAKPEENKGAVRYTTFWPADYQARIEDGVFEILDGAGSVVLRDGEEADIAGKVIYGYSEQLHNELPGGYSGPYLIVNEILRGEE
ncbi:MAG: hypothetical protein Q8O55_13065 [Dehalococcoidales bacterium]|nr:hypothetical protein [Dehalococcoidales bacterium]